MLDWVESIPRTDPSAFFWFLGFANVHPGARSWITTRAMGQHPKERAVANFRVLPQGRTENQEPSGLRLSFVFDALSSCATSRLRISLPVDLRRQRRESRTSNAEPPSKFKCHGLKTSVWHQYFLNQWTMQD